MFIAYDHDHHFLYFDVAQLSGPSTCVCWPASWAASKHRDCKFYLCLTNLTVQNLCNTLFSTMLLHFNLIPDLMRISIRYGPKAGFNFTLEGALLSGAGFEPTSSHGY